MVWHEIRIMFSESGEPRNWPSENYEFIRQRLFQIVDDVGLDRYLIFSYFKEGQRDYIRFRIEADEEKSLKVKETLDKMKGKGTIFDYECESWSAKNDAELRIDSTREKIQEMSNIQIPADNWRIAGRADDKWAIGPGDYSRKVRQFTIMMEEVIGQCTRIFMDKLEEKPDDRWLMSVFVHLLLNSICCSESEENEVRTFPAV